MAPKRKAAAPAAKKPAAQKKAKETKAEVEAAPAVVDAAGLGIIIEACKS